MADELRIRRRKTEEVLRYSFSKEELAQHSATLAQGNIEKLRIEEEAKQVSADYKARIQRVQAEINVAANRIYSGYEMRPVACEKVSDYTMGEVYFVRLDTGEEFNRRKMTELELQQELALE